jgi:S-adenosylmethionine synthetase
VQENGKPMTDGQIAEKIKTIFDLRPYAIVERFGLKNPIFAPTSSYGHFGRTPYKQMVTICQDGQKVQKEVEFFTWEKLDYVDKIKQTFNI